MFSCISERTQSSDLSTPTEMEQKAVRLATSSAERTGRAEQFVHKSSLSHANSQSVHIGKQKGTELDQHEKQES